MNAGRERPSVVNALSIERRHLQQLVGLLYCSLGGIAAIIIDFAVRRAFKRGTATLLI